MRSGDHTDHPWLATLVRELFQTEQSASTHPLVEAERLGELPPAEPMRAVARHAESALAELPDVVKQHRLPVSVGGRIVGAAFSAIRNRFADLLASSEKSYRGTLLGMRHGVDLVALVEHVARHDGADAFAQWCDTWLARRRPLVSEVAHQLGWFAANPELAQRPARRTPLGLGLRGAAHGWGRLAEAVRR